MPPDTTLKDVFDALASKFRRLHELRVDRDLAAAAAKSTEKEYREYEAELWDEVAESPLTGAIKLDLGGEIGEVTFQVNETHYGRLLDKEKAVAAFKARHEDDVMVEGQVSKKRLNELVRRYLEEGDPAGLPEGVDWTTKRYISISGMGD